MSTLLCLYRIVPMIAAPLLVLLTGGCALNTKPGATSIFDAFDTRPAPGDAAEMATDPYDANNRAAGTLALANMPFAGEPLYLRLFTANAGDADPAVRVAALRGLAMHGDPSHVPILLKALGDRDKIVRLEASRGLQRLHNIVAVEPLLVAVREPDLANPGVTAETEPDIRAQAALALGQYPERRVLQALIAALDDSDLAVNASAHESLRTLTGQDLGMEQATWFAWLERAGEPFAGRTIYHYPVFSRARKFYEYIPFVPQPPNEVAGPPAGMALP